MDENAIGGPMTMLEDDSLFFKNVGQRIAELRREAGMTQAQLAELLQLKQQVVASYEIARRRLPLSLLPAMAKSLGVTVEELIGTPSENAKRGPTPKLQRQVQQVLHLPKSKQRFVSEFLDTILQQKA
jgi:transcriptional regulator with XRE-family HTH domain